MGKCVCCHGSVRKNLATHPGIFNSGTSFQTEIWCFTAKIKLEILMPNVPSGFLLIKLHRTCDLQNNKRKGLVWSVPWGKQSANLQVVHVCNDYFLTLIWLQVNWSGNKRVECIPRQTETFHSNQCTSTFRGLDNQLTDHDNGDRLGKGLPVKNYHI